MPNVSSIEQFKPLTTLQVNFIREIKRVCNVIGMLIERLCVLLARITIQYPNVP